MFLLIEQGLYDQPRALRKNRSKLLKDILENASRGNRENIFLIGKSNLIEQERNNGSLLDNICIDGLEDNNTNDDMTDG